MNPQDLIQSMMHLLLQRRDDLLALTDDLLVLGIVVHVKSLD